MSTTPLRSPSRFLVELQNMLNGLTNPASSSLSTLSIGGSSLTLAAVIAKLKAFLVLFTAVAQTKQAYAAAVAARKAGLLIAHPFYVNLVNSLKQIIGDTNQAQLAVYGISPPKARAAPSLETRTIAKAKAQATRKARGTMGKKAKLSITATPQPSLQVFGADGQRLVASTSTSSPGPSSAPSATPSSTPAPASPPGPTH